MSDLLWSFPAVIQSIGNPNRSVGVDDKPRSSANLFRFQTQIHGRGSHFLRIPLPPGEVIFASFLDHGLDRTHLHIVRAELTRRLPS